MSKELLIVESPAKSKTISKFLGNQYEVLSSYGHIRDLKTKGMGVDIPNNFAPEYEISEEKEGVVKRLREAAEKASKVWLASDEDREGEAIAWHLSEVLEIGTNQANRIVFHEITPKAIQKALETPRKIDMKMVDAQQARRILDRIVGFELSPILWHKIKPSLSAGRVQSVAVRILVEREREIQAFTSQSSYRLRATFETDGGDLLEAEMDSRVSTLEEARAILEKLKEGVFTVSQVEVKPAKRQPAPPFTTSTLQQEAARKLNLPVSQTMRIAQKLYEEGLITYMRTDSVNLSESAISSTAEEIVQAYGEEYLKVRHFKTQTKGAQEAHEAIRPTHIEQGSISGSRQEQALYDLIRKRTLATQMSDAVLERTQVDIESSHGYRFVARGEVIVFDGFLKVYLEGTDEESGETESKLLPKISKGQSLETTEIVATERFTQRPPRYTEASLVKKLEELGIGRPSTYAPTIQTIQKRGYVERKTLDGVPREYTELKLKKGHITEKVHKEIFGADRQKLVPTDVGIVVNDYLVHNFPKVLNYNFTAEVEKKFDSIADGKQKWEKVIADFYSFFHENVEEALSTREERKIGERELGIDPESGHRVFAKIGRYGPMIQLGEASSDGASKPRFASIPANLSIEAITLEEALRLFDLPRRLGTYEGKVIEANTGRFGPYVKIDKLFASIPKDMSAYEITLDEAISLIEKKRREEKNKTIAVFGEKDPIMVLNGRFGPYISYKKKNYKIPKEIDPTTLTEEMTKEIIAESSSEKKTKTATKKKSSTQKKTTKK